MCVGILHTHGLIKILVNLLILKAQIELNSISMTKNDPKITKLDKYDVEANIDEIANTDEHSAYKYAFTALSNPKAIQHPKAIRAKTKPILLKRLYFWNKFTNSLH